MSSLTILDVSLGCLGLFLLARLLNGNGGKLPLPPGPRGLPFIGNVMDMPKSHEWYTFIQWSKKWGEWSL